MTTDIQPAAAGTVQGPSPDDQFRAYLQDRAETDKADASGRVMEQQVERIITAASPDEVWDADQGGTIQGRDLNGIELTVLSIRVSRSSREDIETRYGVYFNCECVAEAVPEDVANLTGLKPGDEFVMQTGAPLVMAKLRYFEAEGMFPLHCMLRAIPTASGNTVLKLVRPPKRAVSSKSA